MKKLFFLVILFSCDLWAHSLDQYITISHPTEIHVSDAKEIPEKLHQKIIEYAISSLPKGKTQDSLGKDGRKGQFDNGTIFFGHGPYQVSDQILVPARVNIHGVVGVHRPNQGGTRFAVVAGGDLSSEDGDKRYVFRNTKSDGLNYNGSFNQHWENFGVDCNGFCRGLLVAGAQTSSVKKVGVIDSADVGIFVAGARPLLMQEVEVTKIRTSSLAASIGILSNGQRLQIINCSVDVCDVGFRQNTMGAVTILGFVFENVNSVIIEKKSHMGIMMGSGIAVQGGLNLTSPSGAGQVGDRVIFRSGASGIVELSGTIRNNSGPKIWDFGGQRQVILELTKKGDKGVHFPFLLRNNSAPGIIEN